jgi:putative ABC transport system substrate-binding protein
VFADVTDPVGQGFVESLARPGGNVTGFAMFEFSMGGKWLDLLKKLVPSTKARRGSVQSTNTGSALWEIIFSIHSSGRPALWDRTVFHGDRRRG